MKKELNWYPYNRRKGRVMSFMSRLLAARDWRRRLGRAPNKNLDGQAFPRPRT